MEVLSSQQTKRNLLLVSVTSATTAMEYGLLMPTFKEYLLDELHVPPNQTIWLGLTISIFSVARTIAFPLVGIWADRRGFREPYVVCCLIGCVGGATYGLAGKVLGGQLWMAILGRFISGTGAARITLASAYIAKTVAPQGRVAWLSAVSGVQLLGNLIGPALNAAFIPLKVSAGPIELNERTVAGYLPSLVNLALSVWLLLRFTEPPRAQQTPLLSETAAEATPADEEGAPQAGEPINAPAGAAEGSVAERHRLIFVQRGGWIVLLISFISGFEIAGLETVITPLTEQYSWGTLYNSLLFAGIGLVAIVSVVVTATAKCCDANGPREQAERPRRLVALGFASYGASYVVAFARCSSSLDFGYPWLLFFAALFVFGVPLAMSPSLAIYSCKVPNHRKGEYMGLANLVQGVGRIAGPLMTSALLDFDEKHWALFGSLFAVYALGPLGMPLVWSKMVLSKEG